MIREKYEDEGTRNFAIGKRGFEHAQWQKGNFPGEYLNGDFDALMNEIRVDVRMWVPIKADSIRIAHWVRCHVLRELVRTEAGDAVADALTHREYMAIIGNALRFTVKDLGRYDQPPLARDDQGSRGRSGHRQGRAVKSSRICATTASWHVPKRLKAVTLDPEKAATLAAGKAIKKESADKAKAIKQVTDSINDNVIAGNITPQGALAILEGIAKKHNTPLTTAAIGFDPATATAEECEAMIASMFGLGRIVELRAIVAKASRAVATLEKAAKKAGGSQGREGQGPPPNLCEMCRCRLTTRPSRNGARKLRPRVRPRLMRLRQRLGESVCSQVCNGSPLPDCMDRNPSGLASKTPSLHP